MKNSNALNIDEGAFNKKYLKDGHIGEIVDGTWTRERATRAKRVVKKNFDEINSLIREKKEGPN